MRGRGCPVGAINSGAQQAHGPTTGGAEEREPRRGLVQLHCERERCESKAPCVPICYCSVYMYRLQVVRNGAVRQREERCDVRREGERVQDVGMHVER